MNEDCPRRLGQKIFMLTLSMGKRRLLDKDKKLLEFVKKGGRVGAKKDFITLLIKAAKSYFHKHNITETLLVVRGYVPQKFPLTETNSSGIVIFPKTASTEIRLAEEQHQFQVLNCV